MFPCFETTTARPNSVRSLNMTLFGRLTANTTEEDKINESICYFISVILTVKRPNKVVFRLLTELSHAVVVYVM